MNKAPLCQDVKQTAEKPAAHAAGLPMKKDRNVFIIHINIGLVKEKETNAEKEKSACGKIVSVFFSKLFTFKKRTL